MNEYELLRFQLYKISNLPEVKFNEIYTWCWDKFGYYGKYEVIESFLDRIENEI